MNSFSIVDIITVISLMFDVFVRLFGFCSGMLINKTLDYFKAVLFWNALYFVKWGVEKVPEVEIYFDWWNNV